MADSGCTWCAGEDVWHAYHLVREGDSVTATTFRKVIRETGGADGSKESEKVKIKVCPTLTAYTESRHAHSTTWLSLQELH